jgi:phage terminase large subunit-like protein
MRADAISVVEGRATDDSMLVLVYTLDEGDDPFDEAVWVKSNPNLGVSVRLDSLREQAELAKRSPAKLAPFLRFRMNVPTGVATRAIDIDEWDRNSGLEPGEDYHAWEERTFAEARHGYSGLDLASVRDLTALLFVSRAEDGGYDVLSRFFCPEEGIEHRSRVDGVPYADWVRDGYLIATPGNVTDYEYVKAENRLLADKHEVREVGFDRWNATQLSTDLQSEGANMIAVPQTQAGLAPGWREIEKAILEHKLRHGGHPILRWMAGNVEVETDGAGNQKPSKRLSSERIDGMVALDMAVGRWIVHVEELVPQPMYVYGKAR